jgi:hypothetical protein
VGLIKEEHQLGLVRIAHFGQRLEQFGQQPQQERGVKLGALHQLVGGEHVDHAPAGLVAADEVVDFKRRLTKEPVRTLAFERQQLSLDRADRGLGNVAVSGGKVTGIFRAGDQRLLQIVHVEQQQAVVIGPFERDGQHPFLRLVEAHQAAEQQRPHFRDRGADRMALFAVKVPEHCRIIAVFERLDPQFLRAALDLVGMLERAAAGHRNAGQIALNVGHEHRHALGGELLGQGLQGHRLAGAGGPGNQAVAVGAAKQQVLLFAIGAKADEDVFHEARSANSGWFREQIERPTPLCERLFARAAIGR